MGEKADKLNAELVPTRSLLRMIADDLGVTLEEGVTADNAVHYQKVFKNALRRRPEVVTDGDGGPFRDGITKPQTFDEFIDKEIEAVEQGLPDPAGALVKRPDIATEFTQDDNDQALNYELIQQIAKMVGADADDLVSIRSAIERAMGEGGDIEVPKGDTLADAMKHGHQENHNLRNKIKDSRLLVQRIANALQILDWNKDGDGDEVLQAIQRIETGKVMMRRRILELRQARSVGGDLATAMADELEQQFTRLLAPHELAEWLKKRGSAAKPKIETKPHPFVFNHGDIGLLVRGIYDRAIALPLGGERSRLSDLHGVMEDIKRSPEAAAHLVSAMETILMVLAKEQGEKIKE